MMYKERFIVVIKHNGKILRERGDVVTLPFGSEYSIMLKNLESRQAVVSVSVDGGDVLDGKSIIVPANSETELKGFMKGMGVRNKFKFIQKTDEISNHRGDRLDDGIVRIEFRFEKQRVTKVVEETVIKPYKVWWDYKCPMCGEWPCTCHKWYSYRDDNTCYFSNTDSIKGLDCSSHSYSMNTTLNNMSFTNGDLGTPKSDEGITVKGSKTNQDFTYGYTK